ncbi:hypothetical protein [Tabrizicola sp.]|uniref:hypothetical protein n=1 Tax=Tabrizicola sp. TaxID=2005166 RepID=UPI003D2D3447
MSSEEETPKWRTPTNFGIALTLIVFLGFIAMARQRNCVLLPTEVLECRTNWARFLDAPPNEMGDTLAGFAGVLAFVWIIITVSIQGYELHAQRKELELTRRELKLARKAQEKQLEVMQKQADIFVDEQRSRAQAEHKETLDVALTRIAYKSLELCNVGATILSRDSESLECTLHIFSGYDGEQNLDFFLQNSHQSAVANLHFLSKETDRIIAIHRSTRSNAVILASYFEEVLDMRESLSVGQQLRIDALRIEEVHMLLRALMASDKWWEEA